MIKGHKKKGQKKYAAPRGIPSLYPFTGFFKGCILCAAREGTLKAAQTALISSQPYLLGTFLTEKITAKGTLKRKGQQEDKGHKKYRIRAPFFCKEMCKEMQKKRYNEEGIPNKRKTTLWKRLTTGQRATGNNHKLQL